MIEFLFFIACVALWTSTAVCLIPILFNLDLQDGVLLDILIEDPANYVSYLNEVNGAR